MKGVKWGECGDAGPAVGSAHSVTLSHPQATTVNHTHTHDKELYEKTKIHLYLSRFFRFLFSCAFKRTAALYIWKDNIFLNLSKREK